MADIRTAATSGDEPKKRPAPQKRPMPSVPGTSVFRGGLKESINSTLAELKKTTWLTRPELIRSTTVVLVAIVMVSLYLAAIDVVMTEVTKYVFHR